MRYLLDTHTLLWALMSPERIPSSTVDRILDPVNTIHVSVVSNWEIAIKQGLGRLDLPRNLEESIIASGFTPLALSAGHCLEYGRLPLHVEHRDPFDRMLVVQARMEQAALVSCDEKMDLYGVERVW